MELKRNCCKSVSSRIRRTTCARSARGARSRPYAAEIDAAENDFFRAGRNELLDFGDHDVRRQAATASANKGNHAVGAAVVAAILDFQDGARAISGNTLGAFNGGNLHGGLRENVAREDFRRAAREGHRIAIEKGQRNEILAGSIVRTGGGCRAL